MSVSGPRPGTITRITLSNPRVPTRVNEITNETELTDVVEVINGYLNNFGLNHPPENTFPDDVLYYRTLADYRRLRALANEHDRFAVIGGGFIGSEIAAALASSDVYLRLAPALAHATAYLGGRRCRGAGRPRRAPIRVP